MKELNIEAKAKAYDEALERAKKLKETCDSTAVIGWCEYIFPELKESEDEMIRKELIFYLGDMPEDTELRNGITNRDVLAWLEKQGNTDKVSYEIAEKEKYDFVSGQFIECRKSFDEFKEDNSYWFEYVGNDTYIGRSDNILNKKFHITPRQLYSLFTQQHCPKEDDANEETNAPTEYGKYIDRCLNEAAKRFFSKGEDTYSVADLFYAGVKCGENVVELYGKPVKEENENKPIERKEFTSIPFGAFDSELVNETITIPEDYVATIEDNKIHIKKEGKSALEAIKEEKVDNANKVKPKFKVGDIVVVKPMALDGKVIEGTPFKIVNVTEDAYISDDGRSFSISLQDGWKLIEQKSADKVEPKFKVDDWITNGDFTWQVISVTDLDYTLRSQNGKTIDDTILHVDEYFHLFTIQDAKDGDVLASVKPFIYNGHFNTNDVGAYCGLNVCDTFTISSSLCNWCDSKNIRPATKKERELLFTKMADAGYGLALYRRRARQRQDS